MRSRIDALQNLQTVYPGQLDIEKHYPGVPRGPLLIGPPTVQEIQHPAAVDDDGHLGNRPVLTQSGEGELDVVGVVFDHQDHAGIIHLPSP
jgi:hypothetical protein